MKTPRLIQFITIIGLLAISSISNAQLVFNGSVAEWNFSGNGSSSLLPTTVHPCITADAALPYILNYSWSTRDSLTGGPSGANCFSNWNSGDYVGFTMHVNSATYLSLSAIQFSLGNYGNIADPTSFFVQTFVDGSLVGTSANYTIQSIDTGSGATLPWNPSTYYTFNMGALGLTSGPVSNFVDREYSFHIVATGASGSNGRIALDHFNINAIGVCVPEPGSALLLFASCAPCLLRRSRGSRTA